MDVPEDIVEFILRWRHKSKRYNYARVEDCFDGFFSTFVLYNYLYNLICENDPIHFPQKGDKKRATEAVISFLGDETIANEPRLQQSASCIRQVVQNGTFYLRDSSWDLERVNGLVSSNPATWTKALLEILYQIRCNTFHGHKSLTSKETDPSSKHTGRGSAQ